MAKNVIVEIASFGTSKFSDRLIQWLDIGGKNSNETIKAVEAVGSGVIITTEIATEKEMKRPNK